MENDSSRLLHGYLRMHINVECDITFFKAICDTLVITYAKVYEGCHKNDDNLNYNDDRT